MPRLEANDRHVEIADDVLMKLGVTNNGTELSYFDILGVKKDATDEEIKKAFRKKATQVHPDKNPGDTAAEEAFKLLSEAHSAIEDAEKRRIYDENVKNRQNAARGAARRIFDMPSPPDFSSFPHAGGVGNPFLDVFDTARAASSGHSPRTEMQPSVHHRTIKDKLRKGQKPSLSELKGLLVDPAEPQTLKDHAIDKFLFEIRASDKAEQVRAILFTGGGVAEVKIPESIVEFLLFMLPDISARFAAEILAALFGYRTKKITIQEMNPGPEKNLIGFLRRVQTDHHQGEFEGDLINRYAQLLFTTIREILEKVSLSHAGLARLLSRLPLEISPVEAEVLLPLLGRPEHQGIIIERLKGNIPHIMALALLEALESQEQLGLIPKITPEMPAPEVITQYFSVIKSPECQTAFLKRYGIKS